MDKDQVTGKAKQAGGRLEDVAGMIVRDKGTENSGKLRSTVGKVRPRIGDFESKIKKPK